MSTQRLLPHSNGSPANAAYAIRLTADLQTLLSRNEGRIKLVIHKGEMSLKVDGVTYNLEQVTQKNQLDVFQQLTKTSFKNIGSIKTKLEITSPISSPSASDMTTQTSTNTNTTTSTSRSSTTITTTASKKPTSPTYTHAQATDSKATTATIPATTPTPTPAVTATVAAAPQNPPLKMTMNLRRLIQLLALGPLTIKEIVQVTKLTTQEVETMLKSIAMRYDTSGKQVIASYPKNKRNDSKLEYFVLKYSCYKEIKLIDSKLNPREFEMIRKNCELAYDHLKYPENHPARELLAKLAPLPKVKQVKKQATKSPTPVPSASTSSSSTTPSSLPPKPLTKATPKQEDSKPRTTPLLLEKKRKGEDDDCYYLELAQRFQDRYKEYEELYKSIESSKGKDIQGLRRLYDLHKSLESWKKQLWNSVGTTSTSKSNSTSTK